jgi:hypothetical protein
MACRLCQRNNVLRRSHIISETFYEGVYDAKHRAVPISMNYQKLKFIQNGFKERLLCEDCELKLSRWESVLKKTLVDMGNKTSTSLSIDIIRKEFFRVKCIRYKEFKLAILSIIWRMSIASDPFFESYKLGTYEEKLRQTLLSEKVPDEKKFPIMVSRYELDEVFDPGIILGFPPDKYQFLFTVQSFVIWGHRFIVFINDNFFPKLPIECFLRNSGVLYVVVRSLAELASPESIMSKIYDEQVESMYEKMQS